MANKKNATRRLMIWIFGIMILLVIVAVVGATTGLFGDKDGGTEVETADVEFRKVTQMVTGSGKVQPEIEVKISPDVSGEIIELRVEEGDAVQQGQLLARIKPDFYAAQTEQAEAGVLQSQANMAQRKADLLKAEIDFNRQKGLFEKGVVSEADFQTTNTQFEIAKASFHAAEYAVQSAQARLRESREQLAKTSIYSPMTGTISQLNVELGERVVGTSQMAGTEMMRVAKLDLMELEVDINENDVVNVSVGDTAQIEIDAYPQRKFKGIVTEIANSARITGAGTQEQVTNFPVKVRIQGVNNVDAGIQNQTRGTGAEELPTPNLAQATLRPGMTGTVDVFTETIARTIAIPIQAVTVRDFVKLEEDKAAKENKGKKKAKEEPKEDESGDNKEKKKEEDLRKVIFVVDGGIAKIVEVETGISDETHIQIKTGLKGGEKVITGPYRAVSRELEPDAKVKTDDESKDGKKAGSTVAQAR